MKLDPRHLQLLAAIVESGSVSTGAEVLGKSQPSVSRTIAFLEKRISQPLFLRGKRPLRPTELGRALAKQGKIIDNAVRLASTTTIEFREGRSGWLRVGGTPFFMDGVISPYIGDFQHDNPDIMIEQTYAFVEKLAEKLLDETLDIAICPISRKQVPVDFTFVPVMAGRNVIACRARHPLLALPEIRAEDIVEYPWIAPPEESPLHSDLRQVLRDLGAGDLQISYVGGTLGAILNVLVSSDTLTVLPKSVIDSQRRIADVAALPFEIHHPHRDVGILTKRPVPQRSVAHRFSNFVETLFRQR